MTSPLTISHEDDEEFEGEEGVDELAPVVIVEVVRRLPAALRAAGAVLSDDLAVTAEHFEGYGALAVLEATANPLTLAALENAGLLPDA